MKRSTRQHFLAASALLFTASVLGTPPSTEEHKVWRAAAEHVREQESGSVSDPGPLPILSRTSFPRFLSAVSQLNASAKGNSCGLSPGDAAGLIEKLVELNSREVSTRPAFTGDPLFRLTDTRPEEGDHLGISQVIFSDDRQTAYLNLDIGGMSGAIVKMQIEKGEWRYVVGCAEWVSWE